MGKFAAEYLFCVIISIFSLVCILKRAKTLVNKL